MRVPGDDDQDVAQALVSRIERGDDNFAGLTWVHLLSPHHPYVAHDGTPAGLDFIKAVDK